MVVFAPVHAGDVGGDAAKVGPAIAQFMRQAVAVILSGVNPESKMGDGSVPDAGGEEENLSVAGSMAYCQFAAALNWKSWAMGCWALVAKTFWVRGTVKYEFSSKLMENNKIYHDYCQRRSARVLGARQWLRVGVFLRRTLSRG